MPDAIDAPHLRDFEPAPPPEARPREIKQRCGLFVGIGPYEREPLRNAPRDAEAVAGLLENDYELSSRLLLNGSASRGSIERALRDDLDRADGETQWVFFFAGHGTEKDGKGYLVPVDGHGDDVRTCLPVSDLLELCLGSKCGEILIILDTCHAGQALIRDEELNELLDSDRGKNQRVRQILCSGNPYESVRDDGGQDHSAFTRCLLEALEGWAGIHDDAGAVHFRSLLGFLQTEVRRRLTALSGEGDWQKIIGGSLAGNAEGREFVFRPHRDRPRIPSRLIQALRDDDPEARRKGLIVLAQQGARHSDTFRMAVRLAAEHVTPAPDRGVAERAEAAKALGRLARSIEPKGSLRPAPDVEENLGEILTDLVLTDPAPAALHQARKALGRTRPEIQRRAAGRLLDCLRGRSPSLLRSNAWQALALLPAARQELSLRQRLRVPFTRTRQETTAFGRVLVATRARRRALVSSVAFVVLGYLWLASSFYLSTFSQSTIVVRAGHPELKFLPGVGMPLVVTDYLAQDMDDRTLAQQERLMGSWLRLRKGAFLWGEEIFEHLDPGSAGLAWWRMGDSERAFRRLGEGIEDGDLQSIEVAGYLGFHSEAAVARAIDLLVRALQEGDAPRQKALETLALLRDTQPRAIERSLAALAEAERAALLEALQGLHREGEGPKQPPQAPAGADPETVSALLRQLQEGDPDLRLAAARSLAALPPDLAPDAALVAALADLIRQGPTLELRTDALDALGNLRSPRSRDAVLDVLIATTSDGSDILRELAVFQLLETGFDSAEGARRTLPVLRPLLQDRTPGIRREAAIGVLLLAGSREEETSAEFAEVVRGLGSGDPVEARNMRNALAESFQRASPASRGRFSRRLAAHASTLDVFTVRPYLDLLEELVRRQPDFFPDYVLALTDLLESPDPEGDVPSLARNRLSLTRELSEEHLAPAFEALVERLAGSNETQRAAAAEALAHLAVGHATLSAQAVRRLLPLLGDSAAGVQAGAAAGLGILSSQQAGAVHELLEPLLAGLKSSSPAVRAACALALRRAVVEPFVADQVLSALLTAVRDADPAVRREAAAALSHWGRRAPGRRGSAPAQVRELLARERDPETRDHLASALAILGGGDPSVALQVIDVASSRLASPAADRRMEGVRLLGDLARTHAETGTQVLPILRTSLHDSETSVRRGTLVVLFFIGAEDVENAAAIVDLVGPLLLDPKWPGRWDAISSNLAPLTRMQPIVAPRTVRWLRELLESDTLGYQPGPSPLGPVAADALIEAITFLADSDPEAPWPLLLSANAFERDIGRKVLARLVAERPERGPEILKRLARYRRSLRPQVRLSAAQAAEMIALLLKTEEILGKPGEIPRWIEILNGLPRVGVEDAVHLALDKLEPGVRHG